MKGDMNDGDEEERFRDKQPRCSDTLKRARVPRKWSSRPGPERADNQDLRSQTILDRGRAGNKKSKKIGEKARPDIDRRRKDNEKGARRQSRVWRSGMSQREQTTAAKKRNMSIKGGSTKSSGGHFEMSVGVRATN